MSKIFFEFFSPYIFFLVKRNRYHHSKFCLNTNCSWKALQCKSSSTYDGERHRNVSLTLISFLVLHITQWHKTFIYYNLSNCHFSSFVWEWVWIYKEVGPITLEVRCYFSLSSSSSFEKESHSFLPFDTLFCFNWWVPNIAIIFSDVIPIFPEILCCVIKQNL